MAQMQISDVLGFGQLDMDQVVRVNEFAMPVEVCNSSDGNCHAREGGIAEMKPVNACHWTEVQACQRQDWMSVSFRRGKVGKSPNTPTLPHELGELSQVWDSGLGLWGGEKTGRNSLTHGDICHGTSGFSMNNLDLP